MVYSSWKKDEMTMRLLRRKEAEYEALVQELEELRREVAAYISTEAEALWEEALSFK